MRRRQRFNWDDGKSLLPAATRHAIERELRAVLRKYLAPDADGDLGGEVIFIDRSRYERLHFDPVPYTHKGPQTVEASVEEVRLTTMNLSIAYERHEHAVRELVSRLRKQAAPGPDGSSSALDGVSRG